MPPKSKGLKSEWQSCNICNCVIHCRDLSKHCLLCSGSEAKWLAGANVDTVFGLLNAITANVDSASVHTCIYARKLVANAVERSGKLSEDFKHLQKGQDERLISLHLTVMKLCGLTVGGRVILTSSSGHQIVRTAWLSQCINCSSVALSDPTFSALGVKTGEWIGVEEFQGPVLPAAEICLKLKTSADVDLSPELLQYLLHCEEGQMVTVGNTMNLKYLGKMYEFLVVRIKGPDGFVIEIDQQHYDSTDQNVSTKYDLTNDLTTNFQDLSLGIDSSVCEITNLDTSSELMSSTPNRSLYNRQFRTPNSFLGCSSPDLDTKTKHFLVLSLDTVVLIEKQPTHASTVHKIEVTFEDIGGLAAQVEQLRDLILIPLQNAAVFSNYGLKQSSGILLFGPPGTGKTMLAKAVAYETKHHFIVINGPEVYSKFYGETESRLRNIFKEADKKAPSIVFIDEIDALCPKRDSFQSDQEKRVVSTLLTLMDGINDNIKQVIVLAATNKPDLLDPALRRPGRLDQELEIGVPTANQREEILKKILKNTSHRITKEKITEISENSHGFVGADLAAICREAGLIALKRNISASASSKNQVHEVSAEVLAITMDDINSAAKMVKPSAMRELAVDVPKVYWSDIGGQEVIKQKLREAVELPLKHPEVFIRLGIRPSRGVLLYGPPGCSKTLIAKALATESGLNFIAIKGPELFNKWVGESERAVRELFRKARAASPSIIFFDEIDAVAAQRGSASHSGGQVGDRVLAQLLTEMDGIEHLQGVLIVAATNRPDMIDKALLRPGRLDRIIYVPLPDSHTRREIFCVQFKKMPIGKDVEITELVSRTNKYSGAELVAVCHEAAYHALQTDVNVTEILYKDFEHALNEVKPRTPDSSIAFYENYHNK